MWGKVVLMALAMYTLSGLGELGLMTDFGLGLQIGVNGDLDYVKACLDFYRCSLLK